MDEDTQQHQEKTVILQDESLKQFQGGFTAIPNRILRDSTLSLGARMTYAMLLNYAWQDNFCFPAQAQIAKDLGLKERMTRYHLEELKKHQLIDWKRQGLNRPNIYYILKLPGFPDRQSIATPDRQSTSAQDRQRIAYYKDSTKKTQNNVNVGFKTSKKESAASDAEETDLLDRITMTLGDRNPKSTLTFRRIIRTLGASVTTRLLANTQEAYQLGSVKADKLPAYFVGMAKNVAKEQGLDLGFKAGAKRAEAVAGLADLKRQIGNRSTINGQRSYA